jgi:hypothetical protein
MCRTLGSVIVPDPADVALFQVHKPLSTLDD